MTATVARPDFARLPELQLRVIAEQDLNGLLPAGEADARIAKLADPGLTAEQRNDALEQLQHAIAHLSCLDMPGGCPCHDFSTYEKDPESLVLDAEADIQAAIRKLMGVLA